MRNDPATCHHPQPFAIVDERQADEKPVLPLRESDPPGTRVGRCLLCGTEALYRPGRLLCVTERQDLAAGRYEPSRPAWTGATAGLRSVLAGSHAVDAQLEDAPALRLVAGDEEAPF